MKARIWMTVAGVACLVAAQPAFGIEYQERTLAGGIAYRHLGPTTSGTDGNIFPGCNHDLFLLGGGYWNSGPFDTLIVRTWWPTENIFRVVYDQPSNVERDIRAHSICDETKPRRASKAIELGPGINYDRVSCPSGTWPYSGGLKDSVVEGSDSVTVRSAPYDSGDAGGAPNGWEVYTDNYEVARPATVIVKCGTSKPTYRERTEPVGAETQSDEIPANCPSDRFLYGGGYKLSSNFGEAQLNSAAPDMIGTKTNAHRWIIHGDNLSDSELDMTSVAVCGPALR